MRFSIGVFAFCLACSSSSNAQAPAPLPDLTQAEQHRLDEIVHQCAELAVDAVLAKKAEAEAAHTVAHFFLRKDVTSAAQEVSPETFALALTKSCAVRTVMKDPTFGPAPDTPPPPADTRTKT